MQLLCDQNVAQRYIDACIGAPDLQAIAVRDALDPVRTIPILPCMPEKTGMSY
ncbi:hypothetical protein [Halobellus marinus]|uniref:hypothetical protein n=1 Tax=Halobellus TaxID=1073986 RepID=UPI0028AFB82E|nr:hypothetical protein [Halobellus sp. DFY28]